MNCAIRRACTCRGKLHWVEGELQSMPHESQHESQTKYEFVTSLAIFAEQMEMWHHIDSYMAQYFCFPFFLPFGLKSDTGIWFDVICARQHTRISYVQGSGCFLCNFPTELLRKDIVFSNSSDLGSCVFACWARGSGEVSKHLSLKTTRVSLALFSVLCAFLSHVELSWLLF